MSNKDFLADAYNGAQGVAGTYDELAKRDKGLRVNGPLRRAVGAHVSAAMTGDPVAEFMARQRVASAQHHPLEMARRAVRSAPARALGVVGNVVSGASAIEDMRRNGVGIVNSLDATAAAVGMTPTLAAIPANAWGLGRAIGATLPDTVNDSIGYSVNKALRTVSGGRLGVDDTAMRAQRRGKP